MNSEKKKRSSNQIFYTWNEDESITTSSKQINHIMALYYSQLYKSSSSSNKDIHEYLSRPGVYKTLSLEHRNYLNSPNTQDEILDTIKLI